MFKSSYVLMWADGHTTVLINIVLILLKLFIFKKRHLREKKPFLSPISKKRRISGYRWRIYNSLKTSAMLAIYSILYFYFFAYITNSFRRKNNLLLLHSTIFILKIYFIKCSNKIQYKNPCTKWKIFSVQFTVHTLVVETVINSTVIMQMEKLCSVLQLFLLTTEKTKGNIITLVVFKFRIRKL